jgi:DNA replication protein DnaC
MGDEALDPYHMLNSFDIGVSPDAGAARDSVSRWIGEILNKRNRSLVLWGNYGSGKTHLAQAAEIALTTFDVEAVFCPIPNLLKAVKSTYNSKYSGPDLLDDLLDVDVIILDDLGAEYVKNKEWEQGLLFRLIDGCYQRKPMLITTNISATDLPSAIGGRAYSRLAEICGLSGFVNMSRIPDYRLKKAMDDLK